MPNRDAGHIQTHHSFCIAVELEIRQKQTIRSLYRAIIDHSEDSHNMEH